MNYWQDWAVCVIEASQYALTHPFQIAAVCMAIWLVVGILWFIDQRRRRR
jgi:hypothetical protein